MEYKKENKKSKHPTSIRFNETSVAIALHKSGKESKQQLVDFLIDRYVNGENPVLDRIGNIQITSAKIVKEDNKPIAKFEIEIPETKPEIYTSPLNQFAAYKAEFWAANDHWQLLDSVKEMMNDAILSKKQKVELEQIAIQVQKDKAFYTD